MKISFSHLLTSFLVNVSLINVFRCHVADLFCFMKYWKSSLYLDIMVISVNYNRKIFVNESEKTLVDVHFRPASQ